MYGCTFDHQIVCMHGYMQLTTNMYVWVCIILTTNMQVRVNI